MKSWVKAVFILTICGLLFSGYLSAVKFFSGSCALNESCPYFLGYPACFYGFGMYLVMFVVTALGLSGKITLPQTLKTDIGVSLLGILFAGSFVIQEIAESQYTGTLGLSTCAYGLIFYISIFVISLLGVKKNPVNQIL